MELQHVPREFNSAADDLSTRASTWAPMPEGIFERRLLRPTAQPAELGEGDQAGTSKLAVPVAFHPWCPPGVVCATEDPGDLIGPPPITQGSPDAWISEIRDYLKDNILPDDDVSAERLVRLAKRYAVVEGDLYRCGANWYPHAVHFPGRGPRVTHGDPWRRVRKSFLISHACWQGLSAWLLLADSTPGCG